MNVEINDFVGNILQASFTCDVTSCYQVHADAHMPICGEAMLL